MRNVSESMAGRAAVLQLWPMSVRETPKVSVLGAVIPKCWRVRGRHLSGSARTCRRTSNATSVPSGPSRISSPFDAFSASSLRAMVRSSTSPTWAAPLGMSVPSVGRWLDIFEATAQILIVPPYFENLGKRLIKSPKIYIADSGLACHLLGIETEAELAKSPFLGALFEGFVGAEIVKAQANAGRRREIYDFRDQQGLEVDFVVPTRTGGVRLIEVKATSHRDTRNGRTDVASCGCPEDAVGTSGCGADARGPSARRAAQSSVPSPPASRRFRGTSSSPQRSRRRCRTLNSDMPGAYRHHTGRPTSDWGWPFDHILG